MTYIVKDVIDRLKASTPVSNAVGEKVYAGTIPQNVKGWTKAIIVSLVSSEPVTYLGGEAGRHRSIVQVDALTNGVGGEFEVNALAELIRNRLSGYRGTIGITGTGAYGTIRAMPESGSSIPPADGSDNPHRQYSRDYEIIHTASVPTLT